MSNVHLACILICVFWVSIFGCVRNVKVTDLDYDQRKRAAEMLFVLNEDLNGINYEIIGEVRGISCMDNWYSKNSVSVPEAIRALGIHSAKIGGNAVTNIVCNKSTSTDWSNNCWESIVCVGDAIRINGKIPTLNEGKPPYSLL